VYGGLRINYVIQVYSKIVKMLPNASNPTQHTGAAGNLYSIQKQIVIFLNKGKDGFIVFFLSQSVLNEL
jgi:hypothetical protein